MKLFICEAIFTLEFLVKILKRIVLVREDKKKSLHSNLSFFDKFIKVRHSIRLFFVNGSFLLHDKNKNKVYLYIKQKIKSHYEKMI